MTSIVGVARRGVRSLTMVGMPHPRNREYRPITPDWLADEIQLAGDLDGARRVWRTFTNRLAQTGEDTSLDGRWGEAVDLLRDRGNASLVAAAMAARHAELAAPRKRAPKTFRLITNEQIAGAVIQAGTTDAIRKVWNRYHRNLGEAHQGSITDRWPGVLAVLDRLGRSDLAPLAAEAQRLELEWRTPAQVRARANARARELRRLRARPKATTGPVRESPALKVTSSYVMRVDPDLFDRLNQRVAAGSETRPELIRRYLSEGICLSWGPVAEWSPEFVRELDVAARELGLSRNALIVRLIWAGLAQDGVAARA